MKQVREAIGLRHAPHGLSLALAASQAALAGQDAGRWRAVVATLELELAGLALAVPPASRRKLVLWPPAAPGAASTHHLPPAAAPALFALGQARFQLAAGQEGGQTAAAVQAWRSALRLRPNYFVCIVAAMKLPHVAPSNKATLLARAVKLRPNAPMWETVAPAICRQVNPANPLVAWRRVQQLAAMLDLTSPSHHLLGALHASPSRLATPLSHPRRSRGAQIAPSTLDAQSPSQARHRPLVYRLQRQQLTTLPRPTRKGVCVCVCVPTRMHCIPCDV